MCSNNCNQGRDCTCSPSIMLEDYTAMEVLMKRLVLLAPSILKDIGLCKSALEFTLLVNDVQAHLES